MKTDNGGQNWALKPSGTVNNLLDVHFTSLFDGFAVGAMGTILISFDGGMSWINRSSALLNDNVYSVVFANVDLGWVAGGNNTVLETRNNASTWAQYGGMSVAGGLQISDLLMANGAVGWVTDLGGAIWRYDVVPPSQPGNLRVSGGSPTKQSSPTILWDAATDEETAIKEYWAKVDGWSPPSAIGNGNSTSWSSQDFLSNLSEGSHTIELYARDEAGNAGATGVLNFIVDTLPPTMSALSPTTATAQSSVTLAGTASDASGVTSCNLFVNNADVGSMGLFAANQVSRSHTFASAGSFTVQARCQDVLGNQGSGPTTTVTVQAASGQNPPPANNTPSAAQSSVSVSPAIVVPNNLTTSNITVTVRNSNGIVLPGKVVSLVSSRPGVDTVIIISSVTNDLGQATFAVKSSLAGSSTLT
ncbi:MAG: YCF48-related protein, partial [Candidatus Uhrbacteria bacterium]|nr:YCF48-related protein [Candidatus Uhrbacteria bacterium]